MITNAPITHITNHSKQHLDGTKTPELNHDILLDAFQRFMFKNYDLVVDYNEHKFLNCLGQSMPHSFDYAFANKILDGVQVFLLAVADRFKHWIINYKKFEYPRPPLRLLMKTTLLGFLKGQFDYLLGFFCKTAEYQPINERHYQTYRHS